jgi:hypothetical protein
MIPNSVAARPNATSSRSFSMPVRYRRFVAAGRRSSAASMFIGISSIRIFRKSPSSQRATVISTRRSVSNRSSTIFRRSASRAWAFSRSCIMAHGATGMRVLRRELHRSLASFPRIPIAGKHFIRTLRYCAIFGPMRRRRRTKAGAARSTFMSIDFGAPPAFLRGKTNRIDPGGLKRVDRHGLQGACSLFDQT